MLKKVGAVESAPCVELLCRAILAGEPPGAIYSGVDAAKKSGYRKKSVSHALRKTAEAVVNPGPRGTLNLVKMVAIGSPRRLPRRAPSRPAS